MDRVLKEKQQLEERIDELVLKFQVLASHDLENLLIFFQSKEDEDAILVVLQNKVLNFVVAFTY